MAVNNAEFETQVVQGKTTLKLPNGAQLEQAMSFAKRRDIRRFTTGWSDIDSLSFVDTYREQIDGLTFGDRGNAQLDLEPLYRHPGLKELQFSREGRGVPPDLSRIPSLEYYCGAWHPDLRLSEARNLIRLVLFGYTGRDFTTFPWPPALESLDLTLGRLANLTGVDLAPSTLIRLELHNLRGLGRIFLDRSSSLSELQVDTCGKATIEKLSPRLRVFGINKCAPLPNLRFLAALPELESFGFDKLVDGDLQPILDNPKIRFVQMTNRKHYSHTDAALDPVMRARGGFAIWRVDDLGDRPLT
jgi:hypothetical protein